MMIHDITEKVGKYKARKRIGRGPGSGTGKTSGRGHKGAKSRAGFKRRPYFEGGQMTFVRRMPKRGFTNAMFRNDHALVNVGALEAKFDAGAEITIETLIEAGLVRDTKLPLKILGEGDVTKAFTITAAKFSASAKEKIEKAGGTVNVVAKTKWLRKPGPGIKRRAAAERRAKAEAASG